MPDSDKKVNYEISVGADTKGADDASKAFDQVEGSAKKAGKSVDDVKKKSADTGAKKGFLGRLKSQFQELRSEFPLLDRGFKGMELAAVGPIAAIVAAVTVLTVAYRGLVAGVRAYIAESRNVGKVDGALAQSGQLTKEYRKEVLGLSRDMADLTGVAESEWLSVLTRLIAFGSRGDNLGVDAKAVEDLAGLFGGREGLTQATEAYAKALQGEFGAFQELGFGLDLSASKHENLLRVQQLAAERGAGLLRAEARSAAGSVENLGTQATRTAEGIGRLFANTGILSGGIGLLRGGLASINEFLPQTTEQLDGLQNRLPNLEESFRKTSESAQELSDQALKRVGEEAQIADARIQTLISRLREQEQQALAVTNARAANALAQVDLQEASGELSKGEANEQRFQIREEANSEKLRIELEANNAELVRIREAIENAERNRQNALSQGLARSQEINDAISSRQGLVDRRDSITAEQAAVVKEREALEARLKELEKIPVQSLGAPGAAAAAFGLQRARIQNSGIPQELEALAAREREIEERAGAIGPEADQAEREIQELNSQQEADRVELAARIKREENLRKQLAFRQESLQRRSQTLGTVSEIDAGTRATTREAARIREQREAEKAARERAEKEEEERLARESISLGENVGQFAGRRLGEGGLSQSIRERAKALSDGGDVREFAALEEALLEAFRAYQERDDTLARQIQQIGQRVRTIATQVENNR